MRKTVWFILLIAVAMSAQNALAQKKPPKKPTTKKAVRGVKGTTQMAGDNGKLGETVTLGKGNEAINFTLLSAEFSASRLVQTDGVFLPATDEKFLVLHFTLHNPNKTEQMVNWSTLHYTVVDKNDVNHDTTGNGSLLFMKEGTTEQLQTQLKPAQKVTVITAIRMPASALVQKLMVQRGDTLPVLRIYFDKGQIKALPAPFADPADATGSTARKEVPTDIDVAYPTGNFDVKVLSVAYSADKVGSNDAGDGNQWFIATISVKNGTLGKLPLNSHTFQTGVKTDDGEKTDMKGNLQLKRARDEEVEMDLAPGDEYTMRLLVAVPQKVKVTALRLVEGEQGREFVFNTSEKK